MIDQADDSDEEDQLQRLQDACDITLPPPQKRQKVYLPTCLDTPSKPSKRIKETPLGMYLLYYFTLYEKFKYIFLYFVLDPLRSPLASKAQEEFTFIDINAQYN